MKDFEEHPPYQKQKVGTKSEDTDLNLGIWAICCSAARFSAILILLHEGPCNSVGLW